jgi:sec-independent protein translocase protein TatB
MLPGVGFQELVLLVVLALVVLGPKDLFLLMRRLGRWTAKARSMAHEFRRGIDEIAAQAELEELRRDVEALKRDVTAPAEGETTKPEQSTSEDQMTAAPPTNTGSPEAQAEAATSTEPPTEKKVQLG